MTVVLIIGFIVFCLYIGKKIEAQKKDPFQKSGMDGSDHSTFPNVIFDSNLSKEQSPSSTKSVLRATLNGWVLNSGVPFELTILNCSRELAQRIKDLCEEEYSYKAEQELLRLFAIYNIKIKEIEEYKQKYHKKFYDRYEQLKRESSEYQNADTQDRADMDEEFFKQAQDCLYELASYDVYKLFRSYDMTIDDEFLKEYGFDVLNAYFTYANKIGKVAIIGKDNYYRTAFEKMAEMGLAIRGKEIPIKELLNSQTLKILNAIAKNPDKEYKRKNQAIEYIIAHPDKIEHMGEYISFRELFKLLPLPEKYASLDLNQVRMMWDCHREEVRILLLTYSHANYFARDLKNIEYLDDESSSYKLWVINDQCKCAKSMAKQIYTKNKLPKLPCHVGCNCGLNTIHK